MVTPLTRIVGLSLVALLGSALLGACIVDRTGESYWVLNDSDSPVIVDVREQLHHTYVVPPHAYGGVDARTAAPRAGQTISIVDEVCRPLQTRPIDAVHTLVYVDPQGHAELVTDLAWSHGLKTAKQVTLSPRNPPCP
jgi:hypothetical protein